MISTEPWTQVYWTPLLWIGMPIVRSFSSTSVLDLTYALLAFQNLAENLLRRVKLVKPQKHANTIFISIVLDMHKSMMVKCPQTFGHIVYECNIIYGLLLKPAADRLFNRPVKTLLNFHLFYFLVHIIPHIQVQKKGEFMSLPKRVVSIFFLKLY